MSSEWTFAPLENCLDALIDYRGKTPEKTSAGIPLITAKIIKGGRIEKPTEFIAADNYDSWMRRGIPKEGDVVLTVEAPLGEVAQLGPEKIALAQRVVTLRGKKGILDNSYLLYLLQTEEMLEQLKSRATGTTVLGIKQSELRKVPLSLPPINQQKAAAQTLKALDDRITLLRETNITLEAITQALFKSWFVDFDPVRAKSEGLEPEGMDVATAALFPDSFEESELGLVPKGWIWTNLVDVATVLMGLSPKGDSYNFDGVGVPLINGPVEFGEYFPVKAKWTDMASRVSAFGDLIFCVRGSTTGRRVISDGEYCIGRGVCAIRSRHEAPGFIYQTINFGLDRLLSKTTGSVFPSLSGPDIKGFRVLCPSVKVIGAYEATTKFLLAQIQNNQVQGQTLTQLRNTLLPRLISGQLSLPETEASIENMLSEAV